MHKLSMHEVKSTELELIFGFKDTDSEFDMIIVVLDGCGKPANVDREISRIVCGIKHNRISFRKIPSRFHEIYYEARDEVLGYLEIYLVVPEGEEQNIEKFKEFVKNNELKIIVHMSDKAGKKMKHEVEFEDKIIVMGDGKYKIVDNENNNIKVFDDIAELADSLKDVVY